MDLKRLFNFTDEDLRANKQGSLSRRQKHKLKEHIKEETDFHSCAYFLISPLAYLSAVLLFYFSGSDDYALPILGVTIIYIPVFFHDINRYIYQSTHKPMTFISPKALPKVYLLENLDMTQLECVDGGYIVQLKRKTKLYIDESQYKKLDQSRNYDIYYCILGNSTVYILSVEMGESA